MDWLGAPDQGAVSSPLRPLGRNGEEIELTEARLRQDTMIQGVAKLEQIRGGAFALCVYRICLVGA
jgi:hypothetical protein